MSFAQNFAQHGPRPRAAEVKEPWRLARKRFVPVAEGVVVQLEEQTASDIILPQGKRDERQSPVGIVIAIGKEVKYVKEGDRVILGNMTPAVVEYGGEPRLFVTLEAHLLGVIIQEASDSTEPAGAGK